MAVRTTKLVNAMAMMVRDEVEIENGHWCVTLVNQCQNRNEMTESWIWTWRRGAGPRERHLSMRVEPGCRGTRVLRR